MLKKVTDETEERFSNRIKELESKVVLLESRQSDAIIHFKSSLSKARDKSLIVGNIECDEPCRVLSVVISEGDEREEEKEEAIIAN